MKKNNTKPLFAQIAQELTDGITTHLYPVGSVLPGELELCEIYNTSRHTVRAALNELQQRGLVSRKKNAGTRVESATPKNDFRSSLDSIEDLVQFGSTHVRVMQSARQLVVHGALAKTLGSADGTPWLCISSLRKDSQTAEPVGWTDVYIDPQYGDIVEKVKASPDVLISTLIERHYGRRVVEIRQIVRAVLIDENMAAVLNVQPGVAGLEIVRQYFDAAETLFEASVSVHPANRVAVAMRLKRSVS